MNVNTRTVILEALMMIEDGAFTHVVISDALSKYQYLERSERSFISKVVRGTVERRLTLDYYLGQVSNTPVNKMKPVIRNILRMSVYQLVYMEGAEHAVCNEAVKLAKSKGFSGLSGFVNGVLRNLIRKRGAINTPTSLRISDLAIRYSTPEPLVKQFMDYYGPEKTYEILEAQFLPRPLWICVNTLKITPYEAVQSFNAQGITTAMSEEVKEAVAISDYDHLEAIPEWNEGKIFVQDLSSMILCNMVGAGVNDTVIDVCAAPGGKSIHIAQIMGGKGNVLARDVSEEKTALINANLARLELHNVHTQVRDALSFHEEDRESADIVLCDLPCSGLGCIGRKPDIKYNWTTERSKELIKHQRDILKVSAEYVKPDGKLIYSTCTIGTGENSENAKWFEANFPFKLEKEREILPDGDHDGFYISVFKKDHDYGY